MTRVERTEGYADEARTLLVQDESLPFEHAQRRALPLSPIEVTADETIAPARETGLAIVSRTRPALTRPDRSGRGS